MDLAEKQGKMLLVLFREPGREPVCDHFEWAVLGVRQLRDKLQEYVCLTLPLDATIQVGGRPLTVLQTDSFKPMGGRPGVAILDFARRDQPYYGCVVSTFPFGEKCCYSAWQMGVILDLPPGRPETRYRAYVARCQALAAAGTKRPAAAVPWLDDYSFAMRAAEKQAKMLLIYFGKGPNPACDPFMTWALGDPAICERLKEYVCLRLPANARVETAAGDLALVEQPAFAEMLGRPGIAIIDFAHPGAKYFGQVVSAFPITNRLQYAPEQIDAILTLPPGTLTQRTLIYAVRTHPDKPASTRGAIDAHLLDEAESHSRHQASIRLQGHHQWDQRFQRINARLPAGLTATEVCAESWPGQRLVESAIECVRCWRLSEGHWHAVRSFHHLYGYDMRRGANGVWYATGIFGGGSR
jgi:hypothetical protein